MNSGSRQLLVTGASGFLGSSIVNLASKDGWRIRALSRRPQIQDGAVEVLSGNVVDPAFMRKAAEGVNAIVHAAGLAHVFGRQARDSAEFDASNETGTANVIDAALECGIPHVVLVSSVSVYGRYSGQQCDETTSCQPQGPYATSKWRGELRAAERMAKGHGSLTILRLATIYGEGDRGNVARLIAALDRRYFVWIGSGENRKSLIYKDDAARACLRALKRIEPGVETFNVVAQTATMREIVEAICTALRRRVPRIKLSPSALSAACAVSRVIGDPMHVSGSLQKLIRDDVYSGAKFETAFDFRPAISLSEGIRREVESLRAVR